jgi:hypothetical protein
MIEELVSGRTWPDLVNCHTVRMVWTLAQAAGIGPVPQGWKLSGSAPVFRSDPLNGRRSNAKLLSNLQDPGPILSPEGLADIIFCFLIDLGPAELLSFLLGSCKPCPYTLLDHGSFEFGEHPIIWNIAFPAGVVVSRPCW